MKVKNEREVAQSCLTLSDLMDCSQPGSSIHALSFEQYLRAMEHKLNQENRRLLQIMEQEEAKRREVVSAKQDTTSIEKLRERKLELYRKEVQKSEEAALEDFVSTTRILASQM